MEKGLVQVYWGDGKGKTTAALGLGLRAVGSDLRVHLIQFVKGGTEEKPGELRTIERLNGFTYERTGGAGWVKEGSDREKHIDAANEGIEKAKEKVASGEYDLLILDEILYAVQMGLISEGKVLDVVEEKADGTELVLTGSHQEMEAVQEAADLVTQIKKIKHPFDEGVEARKGIEY